MKRLLPTNYKTTALIVGAGPVGVTCSLLLSKYNIPHLLIDKNDNTTNLPQAHYISNRSMEVWRHLGNLDSDIQNQIPTLDNWRHIVYCSSLNSSDLLAKRDHFRGFETFDDTYYDPNSPCKVGHLPQNRLLSILHSKLNKINNHNISDNSKSDSDFKFKMGLRWLGYSFNQSNISMGSPYIESILEDKNSGQTIQCQSQFLIAADGSHSTIRKSLNFELYGEDCLQSLINVYFTSKEFSEFAHKCYPGMLYFVFNNKALAIMVAHDFDRGEFVLQIPYFPGAQDENYLKSIDHCTSLIYSIAGNSLTDLSIEEIKLWKMSAKVSENLMDHDSNRIFLVGDSAHVIPPAGGLGMNMGIADAYNLCWKIARIVKNNSSNILDEHSIRLLKSYEEERKLVAQYTCQVAIDNFNRSLSIPTTLGIYWPLAKNTANFISFLTSQLEREQYNNNHHQFNFISSVTNSISNSLKSTFNYTYKFSLESLLAIRSLPILDELSKAKINKILEDPFSNLGLLYPGVDLGYSYPDLNLNANFNKNTHLELSSSPFELLPSNLNGCRIPHEYVYLKDEDATGHLTRVSTIDFCHLSQSPVYCCIFFNRETLQLIKNFINFDDGNHINPDILTSKDLVFINWDDHQTVQSSKDHIKLIDGCFDFNQSNGFDRKSEILNIPIYNVFSSPKIKDKFLDRFKGNKENEIRFIILRPDGHIIGFHEFNAYNQFDDYKSEFVKYLNRMI